MSNEKKEIVIEKLPTYGKPLSLKSSKQRGSSILSIPNLELIKKIAKSNESNESKK